MDFLKELRYTLEAALAVAKDVAETAVQKSKETASVAKLRLEIARRNREMIQEFTELGIRTYELLKADQGESIPDDPRIRSAIDHIDELKRTIDALEEQIRQEKKESEGEHAEEAA